MSKDFEDTVTSEIEINLIKRVSRKKSKELDKISENLSLSEGRFTIKGTKGFFAILSKDAQELSEVTGDSEFIGDYSCNSGVSGLVFEKKNHPGNSRVVLSDSTCINIRWK